MKPLSILLVLTAVFTVSCSFVSRKQEKKDESTKITFTERKADQAIDVLVDGKLFTSYRWPDNICKPVLYPVCTSAGTEVTRGFPIQPKTGERADHPHQVGMWLTYGDVNGNDFWGNGSKGLGTRNANGGVIKHVKVDKMSEGEGEGVLITSESWKDSTGVELLKEHSEYHFIADGFIRIIDRMTTLTAGSKDILMPDTKEGMFGIRVARQLELPTQDELILYNAEGHLEKVTAMSNVGITGNYHSSEKITGSDVWSTRARWMDLYGKIGDEKISMVICDHPENKSYPTWWHARGYGLFSANPLGANDFTKGKEQVNFSIPAGKSATFRYRVIISSGSWLTYDEIDTYASDFADKH